MSDQSDGKQDKQPQQTPIPAGWAKPGAGRKYHYFPADDLVSLCRRWMLRGGPGERDDTQDEHKDNCVACQRLVVMHRIQQDAVKAQAARVQAAWDAQREAERQAKRTKLEQKDTPR